MRWILGINEDARPFEEDQTRREMMLKTVAVFAAIAMSTAAMAQQSGSAGSGTPTGPDAKVAVNGKKLDNSGASKPMKAKTKSQKTMSHSKAHSTDTMSGDRSMAPGNSM
jgi:hypothetical protein